MLGFEQTLYVGQIVLSKSSLTVLYCRYTPVMMQLEESERAEVLLAAGWPSEMISVDDHMTTHCPKRLT